MVHRMRLGAIKVVAGYYKINVTMARKTNILTSRFAMVIKTPAIPFASAIPLNRMYKRMKREINVSEGCVVTADKNTPRRGRPECQDPGNKKNWTDKEQKLLIFTYLEVNFTSSSILIRPRVPRF